MRTCTHGGWAHRQWVSTTFFTRKKNVINFSCAPDAGGVQTSGLWISSPTLFQLSHPVTLSLLLPVYPSSSPDRLQVWWNFGMFSAAGRTESLILAQGRHFALNRGHSSVVRELEFKSKDPGFDPLVGMLYSALLYSTLLYSTLETVFLSLQVNSCADLFVPDPPPPFVCTALIHICMHVKDPVSKWKNRPHSQWYGNMKALHTGKKNLGSAILCLLAFPRESSLNFPCIALGQELSILVIVSCFKLFQMKRKKLGYFEVRDWCSMAWQVSWGCMSFEWRWQGPLHCVQCEMDCI